MYVGAKNRARAYDLHFSVAPLFATQDYMFDSSRSACISDHRNPVQCCKSKSISLILGKFVAVIPSAFVLSSLVPRNSWFGLSSLVTRNPGIGFVFGHPLVLLIIIISTTVINVTVINYV